MEFKARKIDSGWILAKGGLVYLLGNSFKSGKNYSPFYLKQLRPVQKYICGLFKNNGVYTGKTLDNKVRIFIELNDGTAYLTTKLLPKNSTWVNRIFRPE